MQRRLIAAVLVFAFVAVTGFAGSGSAGPIRSKYRAEYRAAVKQAGARAVGRNIVKWGLPNGKAPSKRRLLVAIERLGGIAHPAALVPARQSAASTSSNTSSASSGGEGSTSSTSGGWVIPAAIVECESGGQNLPPNGATASGYYQIIDGTWSAYGGSTQHASDASKAEQDRVAAAIWAKDGPGAWVCKG